MSYEPLVMPTLAGAGIANRPNFSDTANFIRDASTALAVSGNSFLSSLADLKELEFSQVGDLPAFTSITLLADMTQVGARPVRPTVDMNFDYLMDRINTLVVPTAPTLTFSYSDPGYSSAMRDAMIAKLMLDLVNGGYGIETDDEVALFNRERDRETLISQAAVQELRRQAASTSFSMPQGVLFAAMERQRQESLAKTSSVNRDIALRRSELYVLNRQATLEKVLRSEEQSISLYNAIQTRALEFARISVQMTIALFEAGIKFFELQIDALLKQIQAKGEIGRIQLGLYAADVQAYAAFVNAIATQAQITVENSKMLFERDKASYQGRVDIVKFRLEQLRNTVENMKSINQFGVEFFRTGLGSTLSGLNGLAVQSGSV